MKHNKKSYLVEVGKYHGYLICGNRGSGKSVLLEWISELFYKQGRLILDLFSAGDFENLYWSIPHKDELGTTPSYPLLMIHPPYIEIENNGNMLIKTMVDTAGLETICKTAIKEQRIVALACGLYEDADKYKILAKFLNEFPVLNRDILKVDTVMCFREASSVIFSHLKIHKEESLTRKALLSFIRKARHYRTSIILDVQRFIDIYKGIRDCIDRICIKRTTKHGLPGALSWIYNDIERKREELYPYVRGTPQENELNKQLPSITHLYENEFYGVFNGIYKKFENPMPAFHHRLPKDDFYKLSGITVQKIGTAQEFRETTDFEELNEANIGNEINWRDMCIYAARILSDKELYTRGKKGHIKELTQGEISREVFRYEDHSGIIRLRDRKLSTEKE